MSEKVCQNCGSKENLVVHHIVPLNRGGYNVPSNRATLCKNCKELITSSLSSVRYRYIVKTLKERPNTPYSVIAEQLQISENMVAQFVLKAKSRLDLSKVVTYGKVHKFNMEELGGKRY